MTASTLLSLTCILITSLIILPSTSAIRLIGLLNQTLNIRFADQTVYNLISSRSYQLNAKFTYLNSAECPNDMTSPCFTQPAAYMHSVGIKTSGGDFLEIVAGPANSGFRRIALNRKLLDIGRPQTLSHDMYSRLGPGIVKCYTTFRCVIRAGGYMITLDNSDYFINLQSIAVADWTRIIGAHGIIGNTWHSLPTVDTHYTDDDSLDPADLDAIRILERPAIEGEMNDYIVFSDDIFGDDFRFNRFKSV